MFILNIASTDTFIFQEAFIQIKCKQTINKNSYKIGKSLVTLECV